MKRIPFLATVVAALFQLGLSTPALAGTWSDHFSEPTLAADWTGDLRAFQLQDGVLEGESASPLTPSPLNVLEIANDSTECDVTCWINVVAPNTRVCTKGGLLLRHSG